MLFLLRSASGAAAEASVQVTCDALSLEEVAEVEARVRTSLLADSAQQVRVHIRCEPDRAVVSVTAGDLTQASSLELPQPQLKDALLHAVEQNLLALERQATAVPDSTSNDAPKPAPQPAPRPRKLEGHEATPPRRAGVTYTFGVGALGELWHDQFALGGRAVMEMGVSRWAFGVALGGLAGPERANAFVPVEWHGFVFAAIDLPELADLRGRAGVGASFLVASAEPGVSARSASFRAGPLLEFGVSRPFRIGRAALIPSLHTRVFPTRREIRLDGEPDFAMPLIAPGASFAFMYEFGGAN